MSTNNQITDKTNFKLEPGIPAGQKYNAVEFNTIKNFQNEPVQKLVTLDDTNVLLDGSKSYSSTIVETGSTRTITAAASGHLEGNVIKVRYQFNVNCTITLANFDTTGNQTGIITPINAGTYDFFFISSANGVNLDIPSNNGITGDGVGTTLNGNKIDLNSEDPITYDIEWVRVNGNDNLGILLKSGETGSYYQNFVTKIRNEIIARADIAYMRSIDNDNLIGAAIETNAAGEVLISNSVGGYDFTAFKYKADYPGITWADELEIPHQKRVLEMMGGLQTKIIEIGNWDMDANASPSVIVHGLDVSKIREFQCVIINDADQSVSQLDRYTNGLSSGIVNFSPTNILLTRTTGGEYDTTDYDTTPKNRGWVTIKYVV